MLVFQLILFIFYIFADRTLKKHATLKLNQKMKRVCHKPEIFLCGGLYWKKFLKISKTPSLKNVPTFCCCHKQSFLAFLGKSLLKTASVCSATCFWYLELTQLS